MNVRNMRSLRSLHCIVLIVACAAMVSTGAVAGSPQELLAEAEVEAGLSTVLQAIDRDGPDDRRARGRLNYRGDVAATLPLGGPGAGSGILHGHVRFGQGSGLQARDAHAGAVNSLAFDADSFAILAQLYYQVEYPLGPGREGDAQRLEVTVGKIDPFVFFDQNAVAGDEATAFLNSVFVHNALLDSGGDLGADPYGFAPGVRAAWYGKPSSGPGLGASVGLFGTGRGADFSGSPRRPFAIVQLEVSPRRAVGETTGTYRVYGWRNPQSEDFDGSQSRHRGWGLSVDQRIGSALKVFGRYGRRTHGHGRFDKALTFGFETSGRAWGREQDAIGVGAGLLATDEVYARAQAGGAAPRHAGSERILECFYRFTANRYLEFSPGVQVIRRPDEAPAASKFLVAGVRVRVAL